MGFLDKLLGPKDPLADVTVKKYFEIICGMRHTFLATGAELATGNVKAKRYVEYFLGGTCDEEKLKKSLELYNISQTDYPKDKTETVLSDFRKSLKDSTDYRLDRYEASRLFCRDEIDAATIEYGKILDVIKDNVDYMHFSQGIKTMSCSSAITSIVIADSFCEGNPITRELVLTYLIAGYIGRMNNSTYNALRDYHDDVALLVLKALHFEKNGGNKENYTTISDGDYRNCVLNVGYYKRAIDDHPFEKEEYIERFAKSIKEGATISGVHTSLEKGCHHIGCVDDYFCDAVCNFAWKEIAEKRDWLNEDGENISQSSNINDVFRIICTYLETPDEE